MGIPLPFADIVIAYTGYQVAVGRILIGGAYLILLVADVAGYLSLFIAKKVRQTIVRKFGKLY